MKLSKPKPKRKCLVLSAALAGSLSLWSCSAVPPPQNSPQPSAQQSQQAQQALYKSYTDWLVSAATVHRQLMISAGMLAESGQLSDSQLATIRTQGKQLELALRGAQAMLTTYISGGVEPGFVSADSTTLSEKIAACMQLLATFTQLAQSVGVK